jgi:ADP-ribose pyrophosphatase YjhB (NUDIX family)
MSSVDKQIRPLALALIRQGDEILVEAGRDEAKNETFFRLLGGVIEFGEKGADAVRRELREELGTESDVKGLVATIENVFTYEGEPAHEIALVYECSLRDDRLNSLDEWEAHETTRAGYVTHKLAWKRLDSFRSGREVLYPEGLLALVGDQ